MTLVFPALAVVTAVLNIVFTVKGKDSRLWMFASLSFTALALCAEYSLVEKWVLAGDTNALESVVVGLPKTLYGGTVAAILINGAAFLKKKT